MTIVEKMIANALREQRIVDVTSAQSDNEVYEARARNVRLAQRFASMLAEQKPIYTVNGNRRFDRAAFLKHACPGDFQ